MSFKIDFDADKFSRDLEQAVKNTANQALKSDAQALQHACDSVTDTHAGQPVDEVFAALKASMGRESMHITIPEGHLCTYAEAISNGRRIKVVCIVGPDDSDRGVRPLR